MNLEEICGICAVMMFFGGVFNWTDLLHPLGKIVMWLGAAGVATSGLLLIVKAAAL